jgi:hypothetical protein
MHKVLCISSALLLHLAPHCHCWGCLCRGTAAAAAATAPLLLLHAPESNKAQGDD